MTDQKQKILGFLKSFATNTINFIMLFIFITIFAAIFGSANTLVGVAIAVAFMTLPQCNLYVKPMQMSLNIAVIFAATGICCALSVVNPWVGLVINLLFLTFIMLTSCEPSEIKPYISFLITYIFCQSSPVHGRDLIMRVVGLTLGGISIALAYWLRWYKKDFTQISLKEQILLSLKNCDFIARMVVGISLAMFIAEIFHLQKPLWISIVVMSLTQIQLHVTIERIKHRTFATVVGILLFIVLFKVLIPEQYDLILILCLGYLCSFFSQYKYKQIINAISAINASLVLISTSSAILNRVICLVSGVSIVLALFFAEKLIRYLRPKTTIFQKKINTY